MATVRAPFPYFGGKQLMVPTLLELIPPHDIYVEAFGGGASLLFSKKPARLTVYNDLDSGLVNFFRVLRDPVRSQQLVRLLELTPYAREEYLDCRATWGKTRSHVERARRWYVALFMSFSKHSTFAQGWSHVLRANAIKSQGFRNAVDALPSFAALLRNVQVDQRPALECLAAYDTPGTLFYLDPPYLPEVRKGGRYAHEMSVQDHVTLLEAVRTIKGKAIISGYASPLYDEMLHDWQRYDLSTVNWSANARASAKDKAREKRIERLWLSPTAQRQAELW